MWDRELVVGRLSGLSGSFPRISSGSRVSTRQWRLHLASRVIMVDLPVGGWPVCLAAIWARFPSTNHLRDGLLISGKHGELLYEILTVVEFRAHGNKKRKKVFSRNRFSAKLENLRILQMQKYWVFNTYNSFEKAHQTTNQALAWLHAPRLAAFQCSAMLRFKTICRFQRATQLSRALIWTRM